MVIADESCEGSIVRLCVDDPSGPDVAITPRVIAEAASRALAKGWRPGEGKGVFFATSLTQLA